MITERHRTLWAGYQEVKSTYDLVSGDRHHCHRLLKEWTERRTSGAVGKDDEWAFLVRSLVRAYFVEIEGFSFALREALLKFDAKGVHKLSVREQVVLREVTYVIEREKIKEQPRYNKITDNLRLRVSLFYRAFGVKGKLDTSDARWESFTRAVKLRNALTHPKSLDEYGISQAAGEDLKGAIAWFTQEICKLLDSCLAVLQSAIPTEEENSAL